MTELSTNTIVSLIDTTNNSGTIVLPRTNGITYRTVLFKDLYGTFQTNNLTLITQSPDTFEDGTTIKIFSDKYTYCTLYANTADSKWVILNGTQVNSMSISSLNSVQTANISSLTLNSLTFGNGNGFIDATALRAILVSTIELDASIGNFSSISGDGSQLFNLNAVSSTQLQSTVRGLGTVGYVSSLNSISSLNISSLNISTGNLFAGIISSLQFNASSINANRAFINRLTGAGSATTTDNLYPAGNGSQIGFFGSAGTNSGGFYNQINVRSTNTTTITPDIVGVNSNIIRIQGFVSTQQIFTSSIFARANVSTNSIVTQFLLGSGPIAQNQIYTNTLLPNGNQSIGNAPTNSFSGGWFNTAFVNTIQANTAQAVGINSTVRILGTLSSQNAIISSIAISNATVFNLSSFFYGGIEKYNYISTTALQSTVFGLVDHEELNSTVRGLGTTDYVSSSQLVSTVSGIPSFNEPFITSSLVGLATLGYISTSQLVSTTQGLIDSLEVQSTVRGLGSIGYVSTTQLQSTVNGLGNIYLSSFNGSTNFLSSGVASISSLTLNSLIFGNGNGFIDATAFRGILMSTIQLDASIGNFSSISGDGSQIFNLNAISSLSLESTITGLATLGYVSSFNSISSLNISSGSIFGNTISSTRVFTSSINTNGLITNTIETQFSTVTLRNTVVPSLNNTFDLGASTNTWRHLFVGGGSIYLGSNNNFATFSYDSNTNHMNLDKNINLNNNNISSVNILQVKESLFNIPETTDYKKFRYANNYFSYTDDDINYFAIASDWYKFGALNTINAANNSIISVSQTNTTSSAATNIIGRSVYFDTNTTFSIDNTTFSNVLNVIPTTDLTFMYPNSFYTYLNCTFSFRSDEVADALAYYFALSNKTQSNILAGEIFSAAYPYLENQHLILTSNHSITVQEQFNISTWNDGDKFVPMMYVKTNTITVSMKNMKFSMVYEPLVANL